VKKFKQTQREKIENLALTFLKLKLQISFIQTGGLIKKFDDPDVFKLQQQENDLDRSLHDHVFNIRQMSKNIETSKKNMSTLSLLSSVVEKTIDSLETVLSNVKAYVKDLFYEKSTDHLLDEMLKSQSLNDGFEESKFDPSTVFDLDIYDKTFELSTMLPTDKKQIDDFEREYEEMLEFNQDPSVMATSSKIYTCGGAVLSKTNPSFIDPASQLVKENERLDSQI